MNTSFRKLIRIAIVLISLLILFNFFGYFLIRSKSEENVKKSALVSLASRQRMLCQSIIKDAALVLTLQDDEKYAEILRINLNKDLVEFNNNSKVLRGEISIPGQGKISNTFEITKLLARSQVYIKSLLAVGNEIASGDSMLLAMNNKLYLQQLMYNESKLTPLMVELNNTFVKDMETQSNQASNINTGKLVALIVALIFLGLQRKNKRGIFNYRLAQHSLS